MSRRRFPILPVLWTLGALGAIKSLLTRLFEPDLWWHLALARQMVAEGGVTRSETLSYTFLGAPYINFEWLAELVFYAAWLVSGLAGIFALKIIASLAVAGLVAWSLHAWGGRGAPAFLLWWTLFWVLRPRFNERPELATLLGLGALVLIVHQALVSPGSRRVLMGVGAVLMILWSNAHGGWVFAPALVGLLAIGAAWSREHRASARFLLGFSFLLGAAGLVNPYGPRALLVHTIHFSFLATDGSVAGVIQEWLPTTPERAPLFWALVASSFAALVEGLLLGRASARLWGPALVVFALWGMAYLRNAALFVFIAGPFLAMWLGERGPKGIRFAVTLAPAVLALVVALPSFTRPLPRTLYQGQRVPEAACRFLVEENIRGRMFNVLDQGGFIEWMVGPDRKIFMDGRYLFFPLMREVSEAAAQGTLTQMMDRHAIDHAIVSLGFLDTLKAEGTAIFPPDTWALVQWDDAGLVYLRRMPAFAEVIGRREYRWARPDGPPAGGDPDGRRFREELQRHRVETPFSLVADGLAASRR